MRLKAHVSFINTHQSSLTLIVYNFLHLFLPSWTPGVRLRDTLVDPSELALSPELETYLASKARANTPAASGAAADVPECLRVQLPYKSVVA